MSESLLRWSVDQLNSNFGLEASDDIVQYILSIETAEEIAEYVGDLLQGTDGRKKEFIDELLRRWRQLQGNAADGGGFLHKKKVHDEPSGMAKDSLKKSKRKGRNKQEVVMVTEQQPEPEEVKTPIDLMKAKQAQESGSLSQGRKKTKFVNLYAKEGEDGLAILLPGRHPCECLAQKHRLINNCLSCGRIVCQQEGSGPCLFCGSLVCTKEEQEVLQRDSNKSQKLLRKLMGDRGLMADGTERDCLSSQEAKMKAGLEKAIQHKEKLLEFDRHSVRRTQVLDDEADYFSTDSNQWLSPGEREALRKREEELQQLRHATRRDRKITLDFAGRQVLEEGDDLGHYYTKFDEAVQAIKSGGLTQTSRQEQTQHPLRDLVNPNITQTPPVWVEVGAREAHRKPIGEGQAKEESRAMLRLQDPELKEMADDGWCLSMHQPWASLLAKGIKRVEGRTWYTPHRGRLWIAAAAKKPTPQEISQVEAQYRQLYGADVPFPQDYPTGCLLGCVSLVDCLAQEQYREQFPDTCEESASPFVFICTSPQELLVKFPMKGRHKICESQPLTHTYTHAHVVLKSNAVCSSLSRSCLCG
nr:activating signal cointegrator 1-like [Paramormyrops kingsleyae]